MKKDAKIALNATHLVQNEMYGVHDKYSST